MQVLTLRETKLNASSFLLSPEKQMAMLEGALNLLAKIVSTRISLGMMGRGEWPVNRGKH